MNGATLPVFLQEINGAYPVACTCSFLQKKARLLGCYIL